MNTALAIDEKKYARLLAKTLPVVGCHVRATQWVALR